MRGNGLQKKDFVESGVGCIHYGQIYTVYGTSTDRTISFVSSELAETLRSAKPGDLVVTTTSENLDDIGKAVAWLGDHEIAIGGHSCSYSHEMDPLYAAYLFQTADFGRQKRKFAKGTKVKELSAKDLAKILVPVPPRVIQETVSETLCKMEKLQSELESELDLRIRQYEYYRDQLLTFPESTGGGLQWMTLSDVGTFTRGRRFVKDDVVSDGGIGSIHYGEIYTRYGVAATTPLTRIRQDLAPTLRYASQGDVVIATVGETVEDVCKAVAWLGEEEVAVHDDCFILRHTLNPKFVSYYFQTARFNAEKVKYVTRAKVKRMSSESLGRLSIPVPSEGEQARIVSILDKFNTLTTDLTAGLPAEIALRGKQYEYYRDMLLTFPELAEAA